jgi:hypothetical protein
MLKKYSGLFQKKAILITGIKTVTKELPKYRIFS